MASFALRTQIRTCTAQLAWAAEACTLFFPTSNQVAIYGIVRIDESGSPQYGKDARVDQPNECQFRATPIWFERIGWSIRGNLVSSRDLFLSSASTNRVSLGQMKSALVIREARSPAVTNSVLPQSAFTLSDSWGQYRVSKTRSALGSILAHALGIGAIAVFSFLPHKLQSQPIPVEGVMLIAPALESYALPVARQQAGGGGGGGDREKLEAPHGKLPRVAEQQITPPQIVVRNEHPKLIAEPAVVTPPQLQMTSEVPNLGNPAAPALPTVAATNGTGSGGGIGAGAGGGVGQGNGPGVGDGHGGGVG